MSSIWMKLIFVLVLGLYGCKSEQGSKRFVGQPNNNPNTADSKGFEGGNVDDDDDDDLGEGDDAGDENPGDGMYEGSDNDEEVFEPTGGFFIGLKPKENAPPSNTKKIEIGITCEEKANLNTAIDLPQDRLVHFSGDICLKEDPFQLFNVVLLIDTSGSMKKNDSKCKRAQSAIAIVNRIHNDAKTYASNIKYSVISFSSSAKSRSTLGTREQAIEAIQRSCSKSGGTDYGDAFKEARSHATKEAGKKSYVFMLSDGQPKSKSKGESEAKKLRDLGAKLSFIYLSAKESSSARNYLVKLTGNKPEQVKIAANVDQLLEAAAVINIPTPADVVKNALKVSLKIGTAPEQLATVATFEKIQGKPGHYRFTTAPITVMGGAGNFSGSFKAKVDIPGQKFESSLRVDFMAP